MTLNVNFCHDVSSETEEVVMAKNAKESYVYLQSFHVRKYNPVVSRFYKLFYFRYSQYDERYIKAAYAIRKTSIYGDVKETWFFVSKITFYSSTYIHRLCCQEDGNMSACIRFIDNSDGSLAVKISASKTCFVTKQTCSMAIKKFKHYKKLTYSTKQFYVVDQE